MSEKEKKEQLLAQFSLPLISAPMFLVSGPELVIASCQEGVMGTFPALNQRSTEGLAQWVEQIHKAGQEFQDSQGDRAFAPFGVNLIVHKSNPRLMADLAVCVRLQVPVVITSLGAVKDVVDQVHSYGGLVFHDVTNQRHAQKAAEAGVDGLIAVAAGAGGHAGTTSPFALIRQIREFYDGLLVLAGGLSCGQDILAAQVMGADLAYMGTRFIATEESLASSEYKKMILRSEAQDIVYTDKVSGIPANFMKESLQTAGLMEGLNDGRSTSPPQSFAEEAKAWKNIWSAGHGVSAIHRVLSVKDLVAELKKDYVAARSSVAAFSE